MRTLKAKLADYAPEEFYAYAKSLRQVGKHNASTVPEVKFHFQKNGRVILRVTRDPKWVSMKELKLLSQDYGKSIDELMEIARKRKVEIRETNDVN